MVDKKNRQQYPNNKSAEISRPPIVQWLHDYNPDLFDKVNSMFGTPTQYDMRILEKLEEFGVTGFYFNVIDGGDKNSPHWLPEAHRLTTQIITGRVTRSSTSITSKLYEQALNEAPPGVKVHTILYIKDVVVDLQSLADLGKLNKHQAIGTQVVLGSPTTGFLRTVTTFVARFAKRDDIFLLETGGWEDGLEVIRNSIIQRYKS